MIDDKPVLTFTPQRNPTLADAIRDAQILLAYASQRGVAIDQEVVKTLVQSGTLHANGSMDDAQETAFWAALNTLAKSVAPVSVRSLRATTDAPATDTRGVRLVGSGRSPARSAVRWYTVYATCTLVLLLLFQIYWLFGTSITSDIRKVNERFSDAQMQVRRLDKPAFDSQGKPKQVAADLTAASSMPEADSQAMKAQASSLRMRRDSSYGLLALWSWPWQALASAIERRIKEDGASDAIAGKDAARFQAALIVLEALQRYILPLLYGLLGTCVFVLRTLSSEIKSRTYSDASNVGFRIRLCLGMLAGMVFAWFVTPDSPDGLFMSLSPFAVAFLAGYSVELLFAAMDRFLSAFTSKTAS